MGHLANMEQKNPELKPDICLGISKQKQQEFHHATFAPAEL